ncbi:unnamed protein product [Cochlearia groenlandica]
MRRKTSISFGGGFLSPAGAPNNSDNKGWSSERVPLPPFYSGRSIPWKWEDAERWICSPVVAYPPEICQQRPLISSKSGPIVPLPSPIKGLAERVFRGNVHHRHSRSCVDLISEEETSSLCSKTHTEEKEAGTKEEEMMTTAAQSPVVVVSRRDIATQMSPEEISPKNLNCLSVMEPPLLREIPCRGEVREVKMDKGGGAKMFNRPKRRVMLSSTCRVIRREQPEVEDNSEESSASSSSSSSSSSWDISEPSMTLSKFQREEAKIAAWENLQKAKAEAAIRELEVKLEKKKSASMDKIINKLQTAKLRAQEMRRSSVSSEHEQQQQQQQGNNHQISRNSVKITHFVRKHTFMACFAPPLDCRKSS